MFCWSIHSPANTEKASLSMFQGYMLVYKSGVYSQRSAVNRFRFFRSSQYETAKSMSKTERKGQQLRESPSCSPKVRTVSDSLVSSAGLTPDESGRVDHKH